MNKVPTSQTTLLLCSRQNDSVLALQAEVLRDSGYAVITTASNPEIEEHIENTDFDIIVLNHTISFADRKMLARKTKTRNSASGVLVLHHSGSLGNPYADLAVDSRSGVQAVLQGVQRAEAMLHARRKHVNELDGKYVVVADLNRNYSFVTDPVCELLGYDRAMLLDLRIDDIVAGSTNVAAPLFQEFVSEGRQVGRITLRHRSGKLVPVKYQAIVEPDGCTIAQWEPLDGMSAG
jgi:CheY-like chemotaxis protein